MKGLPFVATVVTAFVLDQLAAKPAREALAMLALGLVWCSGLWTVIASRRRLASSAGPSLLFLAAIVLLRHAGGGSSSGWGPLVQLPTFAISMYGSRRQSILVLVATGFALLMPVAIFGAPEYPSTSLKPAVLLLSISILIENVVMSYRATILREQEQLAVVQQRWQQLAEVAVDADIEVAADGTLLDASESINTILGIEREDAVGTNALSEVHPDDVDAVRAALARALTETVVIEFRLWQTFGRSTCWLEAVARPNVTGRSARVGLRDVTQRRGELDRLRQAARLDALTGLLNREAIDRILSTLLANHSDQVTYAFFIDLDGFKPVNDTYGHRVGDQVLRLVAQRLESVLAHGEHLARFGGDEFAIVGCVPAEVVRLRQPSQRLASAVDQPLTLDDGRVVNVTGSIGFAVAHPEWNADQLLAAADASMYEAKRGRRQSRERVDASG